MDTSEQFWVYVLENSNGRFDIGQTEDLPRRVSEHNESGPTRGKFTLKNGIIKRDRWTGPYTHYLNLSVTTGNVLVI